MGYAVGLLLEPAAIAFHELGKRHERRIDRRRTPDARIDKHHALLFEAEVCLVGEYGNSVFLLVEPDQLWVNLDRGFQLRQAHLSHPSVERFSDQIMFA